MLQLPSLLGRQLIPDALPEEHVSACIRPRRGAEAVVERHDVPPRVEDSAVVEGPIEGQRIGVVDDATDAFHEWLERALLRERQLEELVYDGLPARDERDECGEEQRPVSAAKAE